MRKLLFGTISLVLSFLLFGTVAVGLSGKGRMDTMKPGTNKPRVYILHSYENDHVCGVPQGKGIEEILKERFGSAVQLKRRFMNTKTTNSTRNGMNQEAGAVLRDIQQFNPDIVFTIDDNAFREVGLKLAGRKYPIVFSGMNAQPNNYNTTTQFLGLDDRPNSNITGVYEKLHFQTALNAMKGVMPELKQIVALLDESPTGKAIRIQIEKELAEGQIESKVFFKHVGSMDAYRAAIAEINKNPSIHAVYPVVLSIKGESGKPVGFKVTIKEFLEQSKKPGMALNFAFASLGLFGGASVDFSAMGRQAGKMGVSLLAGQKIENLPIESAQEYLLTFNKSRADMLGIKIPDELIGAAIMYDTMALLSKSR